IAREIAAAFSMKPSRPEVKLLDLKASAIRTALEAGADGAQFFGCTIEGVKVGPSPQWLQRRLEALGLRPINNVVDATNYLLLETGQPSHAYDADRLEGDVLRITEAKKGIRFPLLDGSEIELQGCELV